MFQGILLVQWYSQNIMQTKDSSILLKFSHCAYHHAIHVPSHSALSDVINICHLWFFHVHNPFMRNLWRSTQWCSWGTEGQKEKSQCKTKRKEGMKRNSLYSVPNKKEKSLPSWVAWREVWLPFLVSLPTGAHLFISLLQKSLIFPCGIIIHTF